MQFQDVFTQKSLVMMVMNVPKTNAILPLDVFSLLKIAMIKMNVQLMVVALILVAHIPLLNVMIVICVPLITVIQKRDAKTLKLIVIPGITVLLTRVMLV